MKKIICIGDSITFGYGVSSDDSWIYLANEKTSHEVINRGVNGDTTGGMLARFDRDVLSEKPNQVLIMGGVNDLMMDADLGVIKSNLMAMCHQAIDRQIKPVVGVTPQMDVDHIHEEWERFTDFLKIQRNLSTLREWLIDFGESFEIEVLDFYGQMPSEREGFSDLFIDGLHLNEKGQVWMADVFLQFISR
jgi:lysophospholipase L1-like esterase